MPTLIHSDSAVAPALRRKYDALRHAVGAPGSALVAFSGGVDSALVAYVAHRELGARALSVTADSAAVPRAQLRDARAFAERFGLAHEVVATAELDDEGYRDNAGNRCFFCKTELYGKLGALARRRGFAV
ncbi:MAG: asparagine synthase-related protein, partial [Acidobacteriota bacterium]